MFLHTRITYSFRAWGGAGNGFRRDADRHDLCDVAALEPECLGHSNASSPNQAQVGHIRRRPAGPQGIFRVGIALDYAGRQRNCKVIGWRHFHPEVNSRGIGNLSVRRRRSIGLDGFHTMRSASTCRVISMRRFRSDRSRVTRSSISIATRGVVMLRRLLMREIKLGPGRCRSNVLSQGMIPTYCHDTVVEVPAKRNGTTTNWCGSDLTKIIEGDYPRPTTGSIKYARAFRTTSSRSTSKPRNKTQKDVRKNIRI